MDEPEVNKGIRSVLREDEVEWDEKDDVYKPPIKLLECCLSLIEVDPLIISKRPPIFFIRRDILEELKELSKIDIQREHGGILYGLPYEDPSGIYFVFVTAAIPALHTTGSSTHLRFNEESWQEIWKTMSRLDNQIMVGWYHTHPDLGVFMSGTDRKTHALYFPNVWQLAIVIDPVKDKIGYFYGSSGQRLEDVRTFVGKIPCALETI